MAIYGRFGGTVEIIRMGTIDDVERLDKRKPDKIDRDAVKNGSYVVVRLPTGSEQLYHQAFLRADGGSVEISKIIDALEANATAKPRKRGKSP